MGIWTKAIGAAALLVTGALALPTTAHAQYGSPFGPLYNPVAPIAVPGAVPGLNPYTPFGGYGNMYTPGLPGLGIGGLGGLGGYGGFNPYMPFYPGYSLYGQVGGALIGASQVFRAYNETITSQEQARIMRQQYYQSKLETARKKFDLQMYIRANTPSFTEEQEKIARLTLRRIQTNSSPAEITNGKAVNVLLDDARKHPGKKIDHEPVLLREDQLVRLNVTKNHLSVGVLRDGGRLNWPVALQTLLPAEMRKKMQSQAEKAFADAIKERADANLLKDLRAEIETAREDLLKRVNETPSQQYMAAKRFLSDMEQGLLALEQGEAKVQMNFRHFVEGGKTVQQVTDFMVANGLRFAAASPGDEDAYRALHSALAAYDVALNTQVGGETRE